MNFSTSLVSALTAFFLLINTNTFASKNSPGWELIDSSQGINMYERWLENENEEKVRWRRGQMILDCTIDQALSIIVNHENTKLWMANVEKVELLNRVDEMEWHLYTLMDTPWPFNKQDMVSKYTMEKITETQFEILVLHQDGLYPKQDGVSRMDTFNAIWEVEVVSDNQIEINFTTKSTVPPKFPTWMQDPVIRNMFLSNLEKFKELVLKA